jgi:tRNA A-37 threonylcarbamoyl transferase component Bud32
VSAAEVVRLGGARFWLRAGVDPREARPILERVCGEGGRAPDVGASPQKAGRRKELWLHEIAGSSWLVKRNRYGGRLPRLRRSKSRRELRIAEALHLRGAPVVVPYAAGEWRRRGRLTACCLVVERLPDVTDLRRLWFAERPGAAERRALASALGACVARLLDAGLVQDDLQPNNLLVRRGARPEILAIDFERARLRRAIGERARVRILAKLDRALWDASAADRLRFLLAVCGGDRARAHATWRALERYAARLARRDRARLARRIGPSSRRFEAVEIEGCEGIARRGARDSIAALLRARRDSGGAAPGPAVEAAAAARLLATAVVLAERGLAPPPLGVLHARGAAAAFLVFDPEARAVPGLPDPLRQRAALAAFLERLLAFGRLTRAPGPLAFGRAPLAGGPERIVLLDPALVDLGGFPEPQRRRRAGEIAERWLASGAG